MNILLGNANFNGAQEILLLPTLLHEVLHGMGLFFNYNNYDNNSTNDLIPYGWDSLMESDVSVNDLNQFQIGLNSTWYVGPDDNDYTKSAAIVAYRNIVSQVYDLSYTPVKKIPVEDNLGAGTQLSHWDEGLTDTNAEQYRYFKYDANGNTFHPALYNEIMSGYTDKNDYLTKLTVGFLQDYGYTVNMNSQYIVDYPSQYIQQIPTPTLNLNLEQKNISLTNNTIVTKYYKNNLLEDIDSIISKSNTIRLSGLSPKIEYSIDGGKTKVRMFEDELNAVYVSNYDRNKLSISLT